MTLELSAATDAARQVTEKPVELAVTFDLVPYTFGSATFVSQETIYANMPKPSNPLEPIEVSGINPRTGSKWVSGDYVTIGTSQVPTLKNPTGFGAQVTPHQGQSSFSSVSIPILYTDELQQMIADFPMRNRKVQIKAGFQSVPSDEWIPVFTGRVDNFSQTSDGTALIFQAVDLQRQQRNKTFLVLQTTLTSAIDETTTTIELDDSTDFDDWPSDATVGYVRIDNEIISHTGVAGSLLTGVTRAALETTADTHREDAKVTEVLYLEGDPITLALLVQTGSYAGRTIPDRHSLGIDIADIYTQDYVYALNELNPTVLLFLIDKPDDGKTWLEREVFKIANLYQTVRGDGLLGIKLFEPPLIEEDLESVDDTVIVGVPQINANLGEIFNRVIWEFDWDPIGKEFRGSLIEDYPDSYNRFGQRWYPITIQSKGLRSVFDGTTYGGSAFATASSQRLFTRYGFGPPKIQFSGLFETFHLEAGDLIVFNSAFCINPRDGSRGIDNYVIEIISKSMNFQSGRMQFSALYTPFAGYKYGQYSSVGTVDYDDASEVLRNQCVWIAFAPVPPDTEGKLSGGADPYRYQ